MLTPNIKMKEMKNTFFKIVRQHCKNLKNAQNFLLTNSISRSLLSVTISMHEDIGICVKILYKNLNIEQATDKVIHMYAHIL